jgi:hypothetical protein
MSSNEVDVDLSLNTTFDDVFPSSMPADLKVALKSFLTNNGLNTKELIAGIDSTLVTLIVDQISKVASLKECGPLLRTYINAIRSAAASKEAILQTGILDIFRSNYLDIF